MKSVISTRFYSALLLTLGLGLSLSHSYSAAAQEKNNLLNSDPQTLSRGLGHYEKSRSLLLAAIREFDTGYALVKPDQVLDADMWRKTLLSRAEELETMLSPRPREAKTGAHFEPDSRLIGARTVPEAKIKK